VNITLKNISVQVGKERRQLFKVPALTIVSREKFLIKGASGRGKTTFLHLLAGLFTPNEGSIHIGDTEFTSLNENQRALFRRAHMGIVFQKLNLIEHLTALENIQLSLKNPHDIERALAALKSVGLEGREHDRTAALSLGEQQRVAVARVLAGDAQIVFADEPTSSLDEKNALDVANLLLKSCADKTLIVVSHDHRIEKLFSKVKDFGEFTT